MSESVFYCEDARAERPALEYQVKASMLFNFLQFVDWPPHVTEESSVLTICTLGISEIDRAIAPVEGEIVKGRRVEVRHFDFYRDAIPQVCHLLFVSTSADETAVELAPMLRANSVLTVGERPGFLQEGGMINFVLVGGRMKFEINPDAAAAANLQVSSKLIRLAANVQHREP